MTKGITTPSNVSSAVEWEGKHQIVEQALSQIDGVTSATIKPGTRGRPVDAIYIIAQPGNKPKHIVSAVEVVLKNLFNLLIDYRVVSIR